jgi:DNA-binding CsgD family transcriptional regulator
MLTVDRARQITSYVKLAQGVALWRFVLEAHEGQAHLAMGYESWAAYCDRELGMSKSRSYQLLDQAQVNFQVAAVLKELTGQEIELRLREAVCRRLKPGLAEALEALRNLLSTGVEVDIAIDRMVATYGAPGGKVGAVGGPATPQIRETTAPYKLERTLNALAGRTEATTPTVDQAQSIGSLSSEVFVGRQHEVEELTAALDGAVSGRGRLVMLVGESGIGKTRTAEELASLARQAGAQVLWGRCPEERGAPTYWPWVQAIRSYVLEQEPDTLRSQMGVGAGDIAQIVPEVQKRLPDLIPPAPVDDPEQARFRLFDSITSFLKRASHEQPLLLVLDNLHWADPTTLRLLEFVTPELAAARVLVLGTYRDVDVSWSHPLFDTLGELTRQHLYQRVLLPGLSRDEVGRVMGAVGGVALPQALVTTVHQQTEGNPLFVREVVRMLVEEGLLVPERLSDLKGWDFRLPEGIREVIGRRVNRLSGDCNEVLAIASVIGREFSIGLMEQIVQEPQERLLEVLEEARAAKIIDELPSPVGHYQFSHILIQQTLASELSTTRKVQLHARIAQALEELYGADAPAHAAELAYHFAEAETVAGIEMLVRYSRLAGERALAAYAYEEALAHFQRALTAKEGHWTGECSPHYHPTEGATDSEMADLLFGLGQAQSATYQIEDALASLGRAFEYYFRARDVERVVALASHPYPASLTLLMTEFRRRALSLVPSGSQDAGRLLAVYGMSVGRTADYEEAKQAFVQALAIARRERDTALEVRTLANAAQVNGFHLRWQECLDHSLQAIKLSGQVDDLTSKLWAHIRAGNSLIQFGKPGEAQQHADAIQVLAEKLRDPVWLARAYVLAYMLSHLMGDFQAARDFSDRALVMDPRNALVLAWRVQVEYEVGEFRQGDYYLDQLLGFPRLDRRWPLEDSYPAIEIPMVARITGVMHRLDVAEKAAQAVLSSPSATPDRAQWARIGLALLAVQQGDAASAAEQYAHLESSRGRMTRAGTVTITRVLGLLAQIMGQVDLAASHFEDTLAFCRKAGYRPELAWTCYDYATLLCERHQQKRANAFLDEALSICTELGMRPLTERVTTLRESLESQPLKGPKYPADLTERQVQVLRLLAKGKTNWEIAQELVLSQRTVEHHLANIYAKIGARNRAEAMAFTLGQLALFN